MTLLCEAIYTILHVIVSECYDVSYICHVMGSQRLSYGEKIFDLRTYSTEHVSDKIMLILNRYNNYVKCIIYYSTNKIIIVQLLYIFIYCILH